MQRHAIYITQRHCCLNSGTRTTVRFVLKRVLVESVWMKLVGGVSSYILLERSNKLHFSLIATEVCDFVQEGYNSSCSRTGDTLKDEENWFLASSSSCSTRARD